MTSNALASGEDFAAPAWAQNLSTLNYAWGPWFAQYVSYQPALGLTTTTAPDCPYLSGNELEVADYGTLFEDKSGVFSGLFCSDPTGGAESHQRAFICRDEDSIGNNENTYIVSFELTPAASGTQGSGSIDRNSGGSANYSIDFPVRSGIEDTDMPSTSQQAGGNSSAGLGDGSVGVIPPQVRGGGSGSETLALAWNGNSVFFRSGEGRATRYDDSGTLPNAQFGVGQLDTYAFCAYPEINAVDQTLDLALELWRFKFDTANSGKRLARQVIADGVKRIDFLQPYTLKAKVSTGGSGVELECFVGRYTTSHAGTVEFAQCFKDDEFESGSATVTLGAGSVSVDTATGVVIDDESDKIVTFLGRTFGWSMGRDRTQNIAGRAFVSGQLMQRSMERVIRAEVRDSVSGIATYKDSFARAVAGVFGGVAYSIKTITNQFGIYGPQRLGRFTLDIDAGYAFTASDDKAVRRSLWVNELDLDYTGSGQTYAQLLYGLDLTPTVGTAYKPAAQYRTFVDTFGASQFYNHRRSIEFLPPVDDPDSVDPVPSNQYELGVWIRGYFDGYNTNGGLGCVMQWRTDTTSAVTYMRIAIYERSWMHGTVYNSHPGQIIASKTYEGATLSSAPNIYDGSYHKIDFRAELLENATSPGSPSQYFVEIDGSPLELDDIDSSVQTQSQGTTPYEVIDLAPSYDSGLMEAWTFWSLFPSVNASGIVFHPLKVRNWAQGSLASDPDDGNVDQDDYSSVPFSGEAAPSGYLNAVGGGLSFGGSFYDNVDTTVEVSHILPVQGKTFESGHSFSFSDDQGERRRYKVRLSAVSKEVIDNFTVFFNDKLGIQSPFYFNSDILQESAVGFEAVPVYFDNESLKIQMVGPEVYQCRFDLIESLQ